MQEIAAEYKSKSSKNVLASNTVNQLNLNGFLRLGPQPLILKVHDDVETKLSVFKHLNISEAQFGYEHFKAAAVLDGKNEKAKSKFSLIQFRCTHQIMSMQPLTG